VEQTEVFAFIIKNRRTHFQIIGYPVNMHGIGQPSDETRKQKRCYKDEPSLNLGESEWSDDNRLLSPSAQEEIEEESIEVVNISLDTNVTMS
jgi:hypothetical protein